MTEELSAGIVIYKDFEGERRFLLLHYEEGHWDFPKGHVEPGETVQEAALRETWEETRLRPIIREGFEQKITYWYTHEKQRFHKTVHFFIGESKTNKVTLSYEHIGFAWLNFVEATERLTFANAKELLMKVNAALGLK